MCEVGKPTSCARCPLGPAAAEDNTKGERAAGGSARHTDGRSKEKDVRKMTLSTDSPRRLLGPGGASASPRRFLPYGPRRDPITYQDCRRVATSATTAIRPT